MYLEWKIPNAGFRTCPDAEIAPGWRHCPRRDHFCVAKRSNPNRCHWRTVGDPEVGHFGFASGFFAADAVNSPHEVEL